MLASVTEYPTENPMQGRQWMPSPLAAVALLAVATLLPCCHDPGETGATHSSAHPPPATRPADAWAKGTDEQALALLQERAFAFFWREAHKRTGLTKDRAGNFRRDRYRVASVASTGFGLAALPVGVERGWITREQGLARAVKTLRFLRDKTAHQRGWFHHFVRWDTGQRTWKSEASTIDTALLLAGALMAGQYFHDTPAQDLAEALYRRVRGLAGARPAWFKHRGRRVEVLRAQFDPDPVDAPPGTVIARRPWLTVATGQGTLQIRAAVLAGRLPLPWPLPWARPRVGDALGEDTRPSRRG